MTNDLFIHSFVSVLLTVPAPQVAGFKALLAMPDDVVAGLLVALEEAGPQFNAEDLAKRLSELTPVPHSTLSGIALVLVSLYRTLREATSVAELAPFLNGSVHPALTREHIFSADDKDSQWNKIRSFLLSALSLERTVGATAKAGPVLTEHERIFNGVRIMTDLRPIYHFDVAEKPEVALIIHMMKITQRDCYRRETDFFFALDSNDIASMKRAIERAEHKEKALREAMKDSDIKILDVGLTY